MTILCNTGIGAPLLRAQVWAYEHLTSPDNALDLRFALVALLSHALSAAWNSLVENIASRAWRGARFAQRLTAADTMVAAGRV